MRVPDVSNFLTRNGGSGRRVKPREPECGALALRAVMLHVLINKRVWRHPDSIVNAGGHAAHALEASGIEADFHEAADGAGLKAPR